MLLGAFRGAARPSGRPRRRRRNLEELEPTQLTTYQPSTAPVPEGEVIVERGSTARDLGPKLNRSAGDIVRFLLLQGEMVMATQSLSDDMIELFAAEIGAEVRLVDPGEEQEAELLARYFEEEEEDDDADQRPRPPVVTVMGHVDHGKIPCPRPHPVRPTSWPGRPAGSPSTSGAYQVVWQDKPITFIDFPGHAAPGTAGALPRRPGHRHRSLSWWPPTSGSRCRRPSKPSTMPRRPRCPTMAVNKMDRPDADSAHVLQQLSERGLVPEAWGGDTIVVEVSALQGTGIESLLEQIDPGGRGGGIDGPGRG